MANLTFLSPFFSYVRAMQVERCLPLLSLEPVRATYGGVLQADRELSLLRDQIPRCQERGAVALSPCCHIVVLAALMLPRAAISNAFLRARCTDAGVLISLIFEPLSLPLSALFLPLCRCLVFVACF